ncbi:hypothetical protein PHPALM_9213 [Phytophthora palmivora]|uniref:Uncharacterized protein n=1 Tax=Phytophthora palmivora TaxID=4796 RepID=A0A2P4Y7W4_9STRA|nr:hypothetical protein PHPALM_9213 [Phytophthora palmivora]
MLRVDLRDVQRRGRQKPILPGIDSQEIVVSSGIKGHSCFQKAFRNGEMDSRYADSYRNEFQSNGYIIQEQSAVLLEQWMEQQEVDIWKWCSGYLPIEANGVQPQPLTMQHLMDIYKL